MRGIAAVLVMLSHTFTQFPFLKDQFLAVDFFFILSGFVVCHAHGDKIAKGMPTSDYAGRRIGRLYPLFAIGILAGLPVLMLDSLARPKARMTGATPLCRSPPIRRRPFATNGGWVTDNFYEGFPRVSFGLSCG